MTMDLNVPEKLHATTWHETCASCALRAWRGLVIISRGGRLRGAIVARALDIVCIKPSA